MAGQYPQIAGFSDETVVAGIEGFIVGQDDISTDSAPALANILKYQLIVITDTGVTPYVVATHTGDALRKLAIAQLAVASGQRAMYYTAGKFNHNMVVWPAGVNTFALRKSLMGNGPLQIGHAKPPSA